MPRGLDRSASVVLFEMSELSAPSRSDTFSTFDTLLRQDTLLSKSCGQNAVNVLIVLRSRPRLPISDFCAGQYHGAASDSRNG